MNTKNQSEAWREELLQRLAPAARLKIENNADYEDVVALLAAWLQATDEHLSATEEKVVTRLSAELAPGGDWKFPVQTLAVPRELRTRTFDEESTIFRGSGGQDNQWRTCGEGWTRPTELEDWDIDCEDNSNEYALVCKIRTQKPNMRLLLAEDEAQPYDGQQLAYVCGDDDLVTSLAKAQWAIQHRGETTWHAVTVTRYQDYLRFERGIAGSRSRQRQLAAWLPPFYPYSRKFLRFALSEDPDPLPHEEWELVKFGAGTIRLAAKIDEQTRRKLVLIKSDSVEAARVPLILNAAPVCQMQMSAENLLGSKLGTTDGYARPLEGVWGVLAATVLETRDDDSKIQITYPPAGLTVVPVEFNAVRSDEQRAVTTCGRESKTATGYQARLYYGSHGQDAVSPRSLSSDEGDFITPFPALGGKNASVSQYGDAGARHAWYHTYLRAPQPTGADIIEILNQIPSCHDYLVLEDKAKHSTPGQDMIQLDIENSPRAERSPWQNYLWPSMVSEETLLEMRASFLSASQVAIMPRMRLHFRKRKGEVPSFLWREMERYVASVLSQYFMIGWYRIEGALRDG